MFKLNFEFVFLLEIIFFMLLGKLFFGIVFDDGYKDNFFVLFVFELFNVFVIIFVVIVGIYEGILW